MSKALSIREPGTSKDCAWCAEPIRAAARVCPHCRRTQPRFLRRAQLESVAALLLLIAGATWFAVSFRGVFGPGRDFQRYRDQVIVLASAQHFSQATNGHFISTIGQIRNDSAHGWKDIELEVHYLDKEKRMIDARTEILRTTLPPGGTHTFRLRGPADRSEPDYVSHQIFVRSARDARTFP